MVAGGRCTAEERAVEQRRHTAAVVVEFAPAAVVVRRAVVGVDRVAIETALARH